MVSGRVEAKQWRPKPVTLGIGATSSMASSGSSSSLAGLSRWSNADGQVAAAHPAGGRVVADVLKEGQQPLQQQEIGCRQLLGHPEGAGTQG